MEFGFFDYPDELAVDYGVCDVCGKEGNCYECDAEIETKPKTGEKPLYFGYERIHPDSETKHIKICVECISKNNKYCFNEPSPTPSAEPAPQRGESVKDFDEKMDELKYRTPPLIWQWQELLWPICVKCNEFMSFQGYPYPVYFEDIAPDGDGFSLFRELSGIEWLDSDWYAMLAVKNPKYRGYKESTEDPGWRRFCELLEEGKTEAEAHNATLKEINKDEQLFLKMPPEELRQKIKYGGEFHRSSVKFYLFKCKQCGEYYMNVDLM